MSDRSERAVAIVGVGAILPDAPSARAFRDNVWAKKYSITEVPQDRWSVADYYDPDPLAPAKTYSKIGAWVRGFEFDWKRWHVPPRVAGAMDQGQQWAITIAAEALADYGYPGKPLDTERTAVVLGNAMAGERHYLTTLRISFPEYRRRLLEAKEFLDLPADVRSAILSRWNEVVTKTMPEITEDTMPGELSNILSGRVANVLNLRGPNFTADAACASTFAALDAAVDMLVARHCDAVLTGGVDRNMGTNSFVKFSKIGALSATGTRPFGDGADGFVMGEGSAAFLLKRLSDAERDGDKVYAVVRGLGGSSDGKGKGITAPNPIGQQLATARAWQDAGLDPTTAGLIEAHGTSTKVGDVVEVESLATVFKGAARGSIALGSAKSNIGHLKAGAGAAGLLKAVWAVHDKMLPPTLHACPANPGIDFAATPFLPNHELREWEHSNGTPRRCGVSAYGFGGTNFHVVLEEHVPGALTKGQRPLQVAVGAGPASGPSSVHAASRPPLRGLLVIGAPSVDGLREAVSGMLARARDGHLPPVAVPDPADLSAHERVAIDYETGAELVERLQKAQKGLAIDTPATWRAFQAQGVFRGSGPAPGKIAFLFTGQGSQYVNMGRDLAAGDPLVASVFEEADRVLEPVLGRKLTSYIFVDRQDPEAVKQAEEDLKQTAITQPAVLSMDTAMCRLLGEFGLEPDMVMGHSLGEYGALAAAGVLTFAEALEAAAARGREMTRVGFGDNGAMAAVMAPADFVVEELKAISGYVVPANLNARGQVVIGGETGAVERAVEAFNRKGYQAQRLPVSHAFHTKIVAPAAVPLRGVLDRFDVKPPRLPIVSNVTADFYPSEPDAIRELLCRQIASPVRWVEGVLRLYAAGARAFVEVGPKRALKGFVDDVLADKTDVMSLFTNRPRPKEVASFNQALAGLYAAGYGVREEPVAFVSSAPVVRRESASAAAARPEAPAPPPTLDDLRALLQRTLESLPAATVVRAEGPYDRNEVPAGSIVISGTGLGLPGVDKAVMDPRNAARILAGEQFISPVPQRLREGMARRRVTQLVKTADGSGHFQTIDDPKDVIKLAGRAGSFDLSAEYGVPDKLVEALDSTTQLAMAAGLDALREAGIPLVQTWKKTTTGKYLPERWLLPESMREETGVVFASAFPGLNRFADETERYYTFESRRAQKRQLVELLDTVREAGARSEISRRVAEIDALLEKEPYEFDRRFLLRTLTMGHSQFAEYIGARGPNTHVNAACASTASAIALAEDWIRSGRCRRVVVVAADNVTSDAVIEWVGAGFIASGAGATDERVEDAALPFDRRRHGTLIGMGACALVVESQDAVLERGMRGIVELLSAEARNSAFHATRLDVGHVASVVESLVSSAERRFGVRRAAMAPKTVFVSHETYTPARGGSAAAEITALREVFGPAADQVIVANTKGFTGHPMGVGIEDVIGVKILEHQIVPPVPNLKEPDPELGNLTLSKGGRYDVEYAIHLAAGFGSQIALTLTRRIPGPLDRVDDPAHHSQWLSGVSGQQVAETEVVKRVLRVKTGGGPGQAPAASPWRFGLGPVRRVVLEGARAPERSPAHPPVFPTPGNAPTKAPTKAPAQAPVDAPVPLPASLRVPASAPVAAPVAGKVLSIVAEKTGYPPDMLDMDLDLEADLGVDTVKQAEVFAAVREAYGIERQENLKLRDFPTLTHVVRFVYDFRPDLVPEGAKAPEGPAVAVPLPAPVVPPTGGEAPVNSGPSPIVEKVLAIVAEKTGYPPEMLELDLDLEADLGVDTVKQAEVFAAVREAYGIERQENLKLRDFPTLTHVVKFVYDFRPDLKPGEALDARVGGADRAADSSSPVRTDAPRNDTGATEAPRSDVVRKVLAIVAEKTGYPEDMLEMELDLEADLGVDTVKQAEVFAAVREAYGIERQENLKLRDFPTLTHVVQFVYDSRPELKPSQAEEAPTPAGAGAAADSSSPVQAEAPRNDKGGTAGAPPNEGANPVVKKVLGIVAEKTGYPEDMLEMELDLEADLGVDTVKQAEVFAAVREAYGIERQENLKLRDFPTLSHVVKFVYDFRPDLKPRGAEGSSLPAGTGGAADSSSPVQTEAPRNDPGATEAPRHDRAPRVLATIEDADRMPRRVPVPSLRPALDWCKPTGVSLAEGARVVVAADEGGVAAALAAVLEKRGVAVLALGGAPPTDEVTARLRSWLEQGPVRGVFWLPALDVEPALADMDLAAFREANRRRVKNLHAAMRVLYESVAAQGTFLVAATRMGGLHGQTPEGATAPLGGAVAGFVKSYKRERAEALVKVVDFAPGVPAAEVAAALVAEALADPGVVEVGRHDDLRWTITLEERPANDGRPGLSLTKDSVFVVTGAAGGITSAIVADLAGASGGTFYLLDLVGEPARKDAHIALLRRDREKLKHALIEESKAKGEKPTPVAIDRQIMAVERSDAALRAIESVEAVGGTAHWRSANLLDAEAIAGIVDEIRAAAGRIDVLVHAGGIEISRRLPEKEAREFDLVFDIKADGFFSLLRAAEGMPIGATVVFSSVAGRFGNAGQTDYSSANSLLCAMSSALRRVRPETRTIAIDWTAWGGIGMATRGSIPQIMAAAGISMLPPESGVPTVRRELVAGGGSGELVVAGTLGTMGAEYDPTGGLDLEVVQRDLALRERPLVMVGCVKAARLYGGLSVQTTLDPREQPFLVDHQIDGVPVLPGVMGTEAFAEVASVLCPGFHVAAIEDESFLLPFKFFRNQPATLHLSAVASPGGVGEILVSTELRSIVQPKPELPAQEKLHFKARVRMRREPEAKPKVAFKKPAAKALGIGREPIYEVYFHGPAYRVIERAAVEGDSVVALMEAGLPANAKPAEAESLVAPRLLELCFQAAGLWLLARKHTMGLPTALERATFYRPEEGAAGKRLYVTVEAREGGEAFDARVVDEKGLVHAEVLGYRTIALPGQRTLRS
jgi:malonyl CoA-acyl carrier protein transacylase